MDVERVGTTPPPEPPRSDTRTEPAQAQQPAPQPREERAPLPEASGWNVDLFA